MTNLPRRQLTDTIIVLDSNEICIVDVKPVVGDVLSIPYISLGIKYYRSFIVDMVEDNYAYIIPVEPKVIGE